MATVTLLDTERPMDVAANEVLKYFAELTEELSVSPDRMSAFIVVVFDQQGNPHSVWHSDEYFPIPRVMVPDIVKRIVEMDVYQVSGE